MNSSVSRRTFIFGSAAAFAAIRVAPGVVVAATPAASPAAIKIDGEDTLEVFSWWTAGSEHEGLQKLYDAFSAAAPKAKIVDAAVAGGAGGNALAALQTRLAGGDPPDSWQSHPGQELKENYVTPGYCEPITKLWDDQGWGDVIPQGLADQVTIDGEKYMIPVGVHRGNALFFNKKVMEDNGITVGETMTSDEFFAAADKLKAAGIPALALGSKDAFTAPHLMENVLCGSLGPEAYTGLWTGETAWDGEEVTKALDTFAKYLGYVNEDHPSLTWDGAMDLVMNGTAASTSMGDWAYGNAVVKKVEDTIGYVAHPDSAPSYISVVDGFTMPKGAPHPINAEGWLKIVGTAEAQASFAPFKGCIPARTDVDTASLSPYSKWSATDFGKATVCPSNAHGAAAAPQFKQAIFDAVVPFLVDKDVAALQDALVMAAQDAGLGK